MGDNETLSPSKVLYLGDLSEALDSANKILEFWKESSKYRAVEGSKEPAGVIVAKGFVSLLRKKLAMSREVENLAEERIRNLRSTVLEMYNALKESEKASARISALFARAMKE